MSDTEWCVVTWNVHGAKETDLDAIARHLAEHDADVIALQEIRRPQAETLAASLGMERHWSFKHNALTPLQDSKAEGAALLTPHRLDAPADAVISSATSRRSYRRRIAQWARIERGDGSAVRVFNIHLSPHDFAEARRHEAQAVARIATRAGSLEPIVVAGDFNDHGQPDVIATLPGIEHVPTPPTNPSDVPTMAIDHVVLPAEARNVSVSVPGGGPGWATLSDHLPVTVRFEL